MILTYDQVGWKVAATLLMYSHFLTVPYATAQSSGPCPPVCLPITVVRITGTVPDPNPNSPAAPAFMPGAGTYSYGTVIQLAADTLPAGTVVEYSTDEGNTWQNGRQFILLKDGTLLARTRRGPLLSSIIRALFTVSFQRMAIIGNSILSHGPSPELGWFNNNGMAASAPDSDFVHRLEHKLVARNAQMQTIQIDGVSFEQGFWSYDFTAPFIPSIQAYKPDLIIVRISENIDENEVNNRNNGEVFRTSYRNLLAKLTQYSNSPKVICTTSFWNNPRSSQIIREVAAERGYLVADIYKDLYSRPDYLSLTATNQYANQFVGKHPSDKGMAAIADLIWMQVLR